MAVMPEMRTRRQEYADATRAALIDAAGELFVEHGYAATSIEDICQRARVSSGALYHHFEGKRELFRVVFEAVHVNTLERMTRRAITGEPSWDWVSGGLRAYLSSYRDPRYQAIIIREGPTALGWNEWRETDHKHSLPPLEALFEQLIEAGVFAPHPVPLLARVLCAAIAEAALAIGDSDDPAQQIDGTVDMLEDLCRGLQPDA